MEVFKIQEDDETRIQEYTEKSYWLENSHDNLKPRQALVGTEVADIAIMGAGFTGLWTAYYLLLAEPSLKIVILEKEITGFGASGRNGGWCSPKFSVSPAVCKERYGKEITQNLYSSMFESVREVQDIIIQEKMNVDWKCNGSLQISLGKSSLPILEKALESYEDINLGNEFKLLNKNETLDRVNINNVEGSLLTKTSASLNPGKLVRQLAKVLEDKGVTIYEQTEVIDFKPAVGGNHPAFITKTGKVTARHAIVLSGEAYISQFRKLRRRLIPMYSLITLTEPLMQNQWTKIGWENYETIGSTRLSVDYLQRTADGRILFGGRGRPYPFASKIKDSFDFQPESFKAIQNRLVKWFPDLNGINFTHSWGGPIGVTRDWTPNVVFDKETRIANAWGYAGQGVSTANLAGRVLSELLMERKSNLTELPFVQHKSRNWELEPFRWLGARYVQWGLERVDYLAEKKDKTPQGTTIAERLSRH